MKKAKYTIGHEAQRLLVLVSILGST